MVTTTEANLALVQKYDCMDAAFIGFVADHKDVIEDLEKTYPLDAAVRIVENISDDIKKLVDPLTQGKARNRETRLTFCRRYPYVAMAFIADGLLKLREDHEMKVRGQMDLLTEMINLGKSLKAW